MFTEEIVKTAMEQVAPGVASTFIALSWLFLFLSRSVSPEAACYVEEIAALVFVHPDRIGLTEDVVERLKRARQRVDDALVK